MKQNILSSLSAACPWRDTLHWYDTVESTNTLAKDMAKNGAPHGTVVIAGTQTAGRGRMGRSFQSPGGMGVYLSVILRPQRPAAELMHLTCATAVAMCNAVERTAGFRPGAKWINDLVWQKKKLGGILTELSISSCCEAVDYAVVGIGINCLQAPSDFPAPLQPIAGSLSMVTGKPIAPSQLAAAMVEALWQMSLQLQDQAGWMARYRGDCITLGKEVAVHRGEDIAYGTAISLDDQGGLVVRYADGTVQTVQSGEVSVRGMYGYV